MQNIKSIVGSIRPAQFYAANPVPLYHGCQSVVLQKRTIVNAGTRSSSMSWLWTFGSVPELPPQQLQQVAQQLASMQPEERQLATSPRIIDVRTEGEYESGHIAGSVNASFLPPWSFPSRMTPLLENFHKDTPVYLVCLSAHRSIGAVRWMKQQGFTNVQQLAGGMKAWRAAGLPETTLTEVK